MQRARVRPATEHDLPVILELIRELAIYEREPDAVEATVEDLRRDGFGEQPRFHVALAEDGGAAVGFALYFFTYSTWQGRPGLHLEDLFVRPSHRGRGLGKALLVELARVAVRRGCGRYQWQVLDWNAPAIDFYERLGARRLGEWLNMRVSGEALAAHAAEPTVVDA